MIIVEGKALSVRQREILRHACDYYIEDIEEVAKRANAEYQRYSVEEQRAAAEMRNEFFKTRQSYYNEVCALYSQLFSTTYMPHVLSELEDEDPT